MEVKDEVAINLSSTQKTESLIPSVMVNGDIKLSAASTENGDDHSQVSHIDGAVFLGRAEL